MKKQDFIENKLNDNIGIPKSLWKSIRELGLEKKSSDTSNICLK